MNATNQIQSFIGQRFRREVSSSESLLDSGLIDSVGIFEIVGYLEESFGVQVPDDEIVPDNFETVAQIEALVTRLRGAMTG